MRRTALPLIVALVTSLPVPALAAPAKAVAPKTPAAKAASPASPADAAYAAGVAALKKRDGNAAKAALERCIRLAPKRADCHWQLGWAYYLDGAWGQVVFEWDTVRRLDPTYPKLAVHLRRAKAQLALAQRLLASRRTAPPPPPAHVPRGTTITIRATGDVMMGTSIPKGYLPPDDGRHLLDAVAPLLRHADLTSVNLEGPLCDHGTTDKCHPGENCYAFRSPTRYGRYLKWAGVDLASVANNHADDYGELCREETEHTLNRLGIKWSGPPGTVAEVRRKGLKIAMIAFHTSPDCNDLNDLKTAKALVAATKRTNNIVIVYFHGGGEGASHLHVIKGVEMFYGENRGNLPLFAHGVIDAGADLVLGSGPHVARAMEVYKHHLIAYSMGNFATYGRFHLAGPTAMGMILQVTLNAHGRFVRGRIIATKLVGKGIPKPDPKGQVIDLVRTLTREDFPKTGVVVARDGTITAPTPAVIAARMKAAEASTAQAAAPAPK